MNPNTWLSFLTTTIGAAAAAAATDGVITGNAAQSIISLAGVAVPFIWGAFIHRDSKVVQTASLVAGVQQPIRIESSAPAALQALADDKNVPTVQSTTRGQPYVTSTINTRGF